MGPLVGRALHLFVLGIGCACALAVDVAWAGDGCLSGRRQSPVDIQLSTAAALPALAFDLHPTRATLAGDGHTLRVRVAPGQGLRVGRARYALKQVHFHTPAGDRFDGQSFPMAAHLLHRGASGQLLAVAVMMRVGPHNPVLQTLLDHLPVGEAGAGPLPTLTGFDLSPLLPEQRGYFRYVGSETAPPCTEGVDWILLQQPVTLSADQLAAWKRAFADNMRPPQPQNGRVILRSGP